MSNGEENQYSSSRVLDEDVSALVLIPVVPDVGYLNAIGRVIAGTAECTGALVKRNLVLTNAHCIFDGGVDYNLGSTSLKEGTFLFRREWLYGSTTYKVKSFHTHRGRDADWDGQVKNDWVILEIVREKQGESEVEWLDTVPELADKNLVRQLKTNQSLLEISIPGYSNKQNPGTYLTLESGCDIDLLQFTEPLISHGCNTADGASGAPLIAKDGAGRTRLVALNVGVINEKSSLGQGLAIPPSRWLPTLQAL